MNSADSFDGAEEVRRAWMAGLAPDPSLTVSQWADRHRVLSSWAASEAGPYRTARTPDMKAVMDALSPRHPAQRVVFMKAAQVGATEAGTQADPPVHFMRNVLAHAGKSDRRIVSAFIATAFAQETAEAASTQWRAVADQNRPKVPKLTVIIDAAAPDVLAYITFPKEHRASCTRPICSIPDDHISSRRSAFFMARSVLRDIRNGVRPC